MILRTAGGLDGTVGTFVDKVSAPGGLSPPRGGPNLIGGSISDVFVADFVTQRPFGATISNGFDAVAVDVALGFGRGAAVLT